MALVSTDRLRERPSLQLITFSPPYLIIYLAKYSEQRRTMMKRMISVLWVVAIMALMLVVTVVPAFATLGSV
jgi:cell division protein FtsW (lipid II flippase)